MDDHRFDSLVRSLASGIDRRQLLKVVFGLGVGTVAGGVVIVDDAAAARRGYPGPRIFPCTPQCDGTTCGDDGCGGTCSCEAECNCLSVVLEDPSLPRICVGDLFFDPSEPCNDPAFACDPNSAFPICEPVSGACISDCGTV